MKPYLKGFQSFLRKMSEFRELETTPCGLGMAAWSVMLKARVFPRHTRVGVNE